MRRKSTSESEHRIRAVVFSHGEWLIAQCLDFDIATQARSRSNPAESLKRILCELERILAAHIILAQREGHEPFADIPKAPKRFWQMYTDAKIKVQSLEDSEFPVTPHPILELRVVA